jgi:Tol biopolymer transport system component
MKEMNYSRWQRFAFAVLSCWLWVFVPRLMAGPLGLASQPVPGFGTAGASGDSVAPVVSSDGRYVLFGSDAQNITSNSVPGGRALGNVNVYLRDRVTRQTTLVSVNAANTASGSGDSSPSALSDDNRYVLFESFASDLVSGDANGAGDVFVRDLTLGTTLLVSVNTNGVPGNGRSYSAAMTPDGRYIAFVSAASDLVSDDTNGISDVFVRDMQSGTTARASVGAMRLNIGSRSEDPLLSADGRYVAFVSTATNLAPPAAGLSAGSAPGDIYVRDLGGGQTTCVSSNARTIVPSASSLPCLNHVISSDGQWVVFTCGGYVLRYNAQTGVTTVINSAALGQAAIEGAPTVDMTPDGRFVVFLSSAGTTVYRWDGQTSNTVSIVLPGVCYEPRLDPSGRYVTVCSFAATNAGMTGWNVYRWDAQMGTTNILNVDAFATAFPIAPFSVPSVSTNARVVAFDCRDTSIVSNDNNHAYDVVVRDLGAGTNELISAHAPGLVTAAPNAFSALSSLAISSNGQFVAFASAADNLVANDSNAPGFTRVFFRDLNAGTNLLCSSIVNGMALEPALSGNGRYVAFTARGTNVYDVYRYDTQNGASTLVSANTGGFGHSLAADASSSPTISADGRYVLFQSYAMDLAPGTTVRTNHYVRDLQLATTHALTTNTSKASVASMTPDGHYVALGFSASTPGLFVFDTQSGLFVFTNSTTGVTNISISPDGQRVAYAISSGLWLLDRTGNTNRQLTAYFNSKRPGLKFSADGRYLVYATKPSSSATNTDVWIHDFLGATNLLVSKSYISGQSAGGASDSPDLTADARYIAYRSDSANIVPGDTNGLPDIFVYDRSADCTRLISVAASGSAPGNGRSFAPLFSADSGVLLFGSLAGNLVAADYNQAADVFYAGLYSAPIIDSDGDGMDDAWELQHFGSLARDGTGDFDGDGVSDLDEFLAGTDPTDPNSVLRLQIASTATPAGQVVLSWQAAPNRGYRVEYKNNLLDPLWAPLSPGATLVGGQGYAYDSRAGQRFYRLTVVP